MDCPECGTPLSTYTYMGREASVCERCGYVGIEVDHTGTPVRVESWDEAMRRFQEESHVDAVRVESRPDTPTVPTADTDADPDELPSLPETRVVTDDATTANEVAARDASGDDGASDDDASSEGGTANTETEVETESGEAHPSDEREREKSGVDAERDVA